MSVPSITSPKEKLISGLAEIRSLDQNGASPQPKTADQLKEIYQDLNAAFFGTPEFAVPILEALIKSDFKPKAVITAPDSPAGRGQKIAPPPTKTIAQKYEIPIFQPNTKEELIAQISQIKPDLIIVAAYGKILPKEILDIPKYGSINVHPSLLPKYRGPSPIQFAILNGDQETGTTIMLMNEKMDEGPILAQKSVKVSKDETGASLSNKLSELSAPLLVKTLDYWIALKEIPKAVSRLIQAYEQDSSRASYTKILTKQDGKIIWSKNAQEIERQIRALYPWPGSFTIFKTADAKPRQLKIISALPEPTPLSSQQPEKELGRVFLTPDGRLAVQTGSGSLILNELQLEGGKPMSGQDFLNGHPEIVGTILQ